MSNFEIFCQKSQNIAEILSVQKQRAQFEKRYNVRQKTRQIAMQLLFTFMYFHEFYFQTFLKKIQKMSILAN